MPTIQNIPVTGFLRLNQILGDKKQSIDPIFPVSRSTWWSGVKSGKYPKPVKLSKRVTAWKAEDIMGLIESLGNQHG
ncbi:helix-turn-helix transcriptional regulator [Methyloglobulus sp.]|uniref:helix-turn-helix transcriptional regulator n=1 Tax=Methyloglobulus sp. TaxID=2518622 RepID=UPI00398A38BD